MPKSKKGPEANSAPRKTSSRAKKQVPAPEISEPSPSRPALIFENIEQKIRLRAYELYLERGGVNGTPEGDWLRAEAEIRKKRSA